MQPENAERTDELYREAHAAHFQRADYAAALVAWDRYLAAAGPAHRWAVEARFNRGVALYRLGQKEAARHALRPLPEAEQPAALEARAAERGLELPAETLAFLLRRLPRDFAAQCRVLDDLDLAALAKQRRLTVPFVRDQIEGYLPAAGRDVRR